MFARRRLGVSALFAVLVASLAATLAPVSPVRAAGVFTALASPARLLDTRPGTETVDGTMSGLGVIGTASRPTVTVPVRGRAGVPTSATAVVVNVTVTGSQSGGYVTLWPGGARPDTSTLNYDAGATIANAAVVGTTGSIALYASSPTHLILDVTGYFTGDDVFVPLSKPQRLADTRQGRILTAGSILEVEAVGRAGISPTARAVALNVTVTGALSGGYLSVFPCDAQTPNASNLNFGAGQTIANAVIAAPGESGEDADGKVCFYTSATTHVIVDVAGAFTPSGSLDTLTSPARILDTRPGATTKDGQYSGTGLRSAGSILRLPVAGRVGIPAEVQAVVLNVTVTGAQGPGYITVYPAGRTRPETSNVNYSTNQTIPNAVVAGVGPDGSICVFASAATHLIVDVAGYLEGPAPSGASTSCTPTSGGSTTPDPEPEPEPEPTPAPPANGGEMMANVAEFLIPIAESHEMVGTDRVAVWLCAVPSNTSADEYVDEVTVAGTSGGAANWANANVSSYYATVSQGRYTVTFEAQGTISLGATDGTFDCLDEAEARTGSPFTNVLAVSNRSDGGGFAGPGTIYDNPQFDYDRLLDPPSETGRGIYLGGGSVFDLASPTIAVHELGHTLLWPHSYLGPWEYDNAIDMMSGDPTSGLCESDFYRWPCVAQNTLAFNRLAAGWIDDDEVRLHRSGTSEITLSAPMQGGVQLLAIPDPDDPRALMTLEARTRTGNDRYLDAEGVVVHLIDQRPSACLDPFDLGCVALSRRAMQAAGPFDQTGCGGTDDACSTDHVLAVGDSLTRYGITINVSASTSSTYTVSISGIYQAPNTLPHLSSIEEASDRVTRR